MLRRPTVDRPGTTLTESADQVVLSHRDARGVNGRRNTSTELVTHSFRGVHLAVTSAQRVPRTVHREHQNTEEEGNVRTLLTRLAASLRRLGGAGAARNAHLEVDRVARRGAELDRQLQRVSDPTTRRAA